MSVAIAGDGGTILVDDFSGAGSVHVFTFDGDEWAYEATLSSPSPQAGAGFGYALALSANGDTALIGAYAHSCPGVAFCGAAFVFRRTTAGWQVASTLFAPQPRDAAVFGSSVALTDDGSRALIGAPGDEHGKVYEARLQKEIWSVTGELARPSPGLGRDDLGFSVTLSSDGRWAAAGAHDHDCPGVYGVCGAVYVFRRTGQKWRLEQLINSPTLQTFQQFGISVALAPTGDTLLVGADQAGANWVPGAAYLYRRRGRRWIMDGNLAVPNPTRTRGFGGGVALTNANGAVLALVGAPGFRPPTCDIGCGAAYVYTLPAGH